jgi:glyoxylase-like metal-dependent hydrolase (beta-lactamase superfamily II)
MTANTSRCIEPLKIALALLCLALAGNASARQGQAAARKAALPLQPACSQMPTGGVCLQLENGLNNGKLELLHVQGNVYMIAGAGGNITVQIGDQAVMVVDTGVARTSDAVISAIHSLTDKPIFFIVDTNIDDDYSGGNARLASAGWALPNASNIPFGHDVSDITGLKMPPGASILAHINVLNRMSAPNGQKAPFAQELWPTDTYEADNWKLYNGESIYIDYVPAAHTDGDSVVLFRGSDVVSAGDLFNPLYSYPVVDDKRGGTIDGFVDGLNQLIDLLVPRENEEGGTYVIPGHGPICDRNDVVNYRDMVTVLRARIASMVEQGMTLEQVKASKPTLDYDGLGRYGATRDAFIEAVYRDLSRVHNQKGKGAARTGSAGAAQ